MKQLIVIETPRGKKRLRYQTGLRAVRQIAERYDWQLVVNRGQVRMEESQHG
ncbi:hypothetical protein [Modicisalibacter luteus]|uniref:Uncharacterized protein n=1 Tax=Modicisalibacter luteus TaxID=453962 RepID=A0ABV7M4P7_9GAMM|nr:hypothetical protein [Halomonas lutea]GHA85197.1 hypothetical protein GCM10007159_02840 [Halomonas lutea]